MTARLSRIMLTSHITTSVGWLGAVAVFLALAITGLNTPDENISRACYVAMEVSAWTIIVPFSIASLLTGVIQAAGTKWGLLKHYWIVVKLISTIVITVLLLVHMQPISILAQASSESSLLTNGLPKLQMQMIADAAAALFILFTLTTISVYKPWGKIKYNPVSGKLRTYLLIGLTVVILIFLIIHFFSGGMQKH